MIYIIGIYLLWFQYICVFSICHLIERKPLFSSQSFEGGIQQKNMDFVLQNDIFNNYYNLNTTFHNILISEVMFSKIIYSGPIKSIIYSNQKVSFLIQKSTFYTCDTDCLVLMPASKYSIMKSVCSINCMARNSAFNSNFIEYLNYTSLTTKSYGYFREGSNLGIIITSFDTFHTSDLNCSDSIINSRIFHLAFRVPMVYYQTCYFLQMSNCSSDNYIHLSSFPMCKISNSIMISSKIYFYYSGEFIISNCIIKDNTPNCPFDSNKLYENYTIANCVFDFNISSNIFNVFQNNTIDYDIPISPSYSIDSCTYFEEKENVYSGMISSSIDSTDCNMVTIHDALFYQLKSYNSSIYLVTTLLQLNVTNIEFHSCFAGNRGSAIYLDEGDTVQCQNFLVSNCSALYVYAFYMNNINSDIILSYGVIEKPFINENIINLFSTIQTIESNYNNYINYSFSIGSVHQQNDKNVYYDQIIFINNSCSDNLIQFKEISNCSHLQNVNILNNYCSGSNSPIIFFSPKTVYSCFNDYQNVYFKGNSFFKTEFHKLLYRFSS